MYKPKQSAISKILDNIQVQTQEPTLNFRKPNNVQPTSVRRSAPKSDCECEVSSDVALCPPTKTSSRGARQWSGCHDIELFQGEVVDAPTEPLVARSASIIKRAYEFETYRIIKEDIANPSTTLSFAPDLGVYEGTAAVVGNLDLYEQGNALEVPVYGFYFKISTNQQDRTALGCTITLTGCSIPGAVSGHARLDADTGTASYDMTSTFQIELVDGAAEGILLFTRAELSGSGRGRILKPAMMGPSLAYTVNAAGAALIARERKAPTISWTGLTASQHMSIDVLCPGSPRFEAVLGRYL
jgi:hypothetical protein